jgi:uroporphyrinogen-III synthase
VFFTSLNGVDALAAGVGGIEALGILLRGRIVAALGRQSCARLDSVGAQVIYVPVKCGSQFMVRRLLRRLRPASKVLYPSAVNVCWDVKDILEKAGHTVRRLPCYQTLDVSAVIQWSQFDAAVIAAPSAVRAVDQDQSLPPDFPFVAIGPTTAAALRERGMHVFATADSPDVDGLLAAIETAFATVRP